MQAALNILGYQCYHSSEFFTNIRDCDMWNEAMDAKFFGKGLQFTRTKWDQLLGSHSAVSADPPAVAFAEDLVAAYPEAKVILVEREIESWYKSFDANIVAPQWSRFISCISALDPFFLRPIRRCHRRWATGWMDSHSEQEMREKARKAYRDHYALVRRVTPKERLLEYRLGDGWEPLCEFLDKPMPDVPFPRVNDSEALQELLTELIKRGLYNILRRATVFAVCFAGLGWGIWLCYRR
jgi:Sulfotransferase domain